MRKTVHLLAILALFAAVNVYAQSLGDVARQTRKDQQDKAKPAAKTVITEDNLGTSTVKSTNPAAATSPADADKEKKASQSESSATNGGAEKMKQAIIAQKQRIASLEKQIEELKKSIMYVQADLYYNGPQYNEHQKRKQDEVERGEKMLADEKQKLEDMQEEARKQGFGSAVYDAGN